MKLQCNKVSLIESATVHYWTIRITVSLLGKNILKMMLHNRSHATVTQLTNMSNGEIYRQHTR